MPSQKEWVAACERGKVFIIPGGATEWRRVERVDQLKELKRWARGQQRETGWLITKGGVPSYFNKSDGRKEPLKIDTELTVMGYNILTSTLDGNINQLSIYEKGLNSSGKYRYWKNRRENVSRAVRNSNVVGLCEATEHMVKDLLNANAHLQLALFGLKVGQYDGSAILVDKSRINVLQTVKKPLTTSDTQILLAALLEDTTTGKIFWFVVLHLVSDGAGPHGGKERVRVHQAMRCLSIIDKFDTSAPVVIVGDLNSDRFLYPAFEDAGQRHVMNVFHNYKCILPLVPTYHHWNRAAFDHILIRGADVTDTHIPDSGGICPNDTQGSDHLPVKAKLVIHSMSQDL
jgi:endonuclease/exonuclease/phosphatase family metal-dependent hydrolase